MSNSDHREINNALNNYYGNKMNLYVEGSVYREEYRQKMKEQKKLVEELSTKAEAFDECEVNLNEVKRQLRIKIRHARRDGDYSEAGAFSEALDMIEYLI